MDYIPYISKYMRAHWTLNAVRFAVIFSPFHYAGQPGRSIGHIFIYSTLLWNKIIELPETIILIHTGAGRLKSIHGELVGVLSVHDRVRPVHCCSAEWHSGTRLAENVRWYICAAMIIIDENKLLFMHAQDRGNHSPSSDIDFPFFVWQRLIADILSLILKCSGERETGSLIVPMLRLMRKINKSAFY